MIFRDFSPVKRNSEIFLPPNNLIIDENPAMSLVKMKMSTSNTEIPHLSRNHVQSSSILGWHSQLMEGKTKSWMFDQAVMRALHHSVVL